MVYDNLKAQDQKQSNLGGISCIMKLSLWILCDALADLSPEARITNGAIGITGVRLFQPDAQEEDYALYLGASDDFCGDGDPRITLRSRGDEVRLATTDLVSVFNRIQDAFSFYGKWYSGCEAAIDAGCTLSELLGMAADVLHSPILIVDAAQVQVAHSSDLSAVETAEDWENLVNQKSISVDKIRQFNQIYKDTFYFTGVFPIPAGVFPTKSHCKHILVDGERLATVIMKTVDRDHTPGQIHLFELFTRLVERWIFSAADRDDLFRLSSYFARTLGGDAESLPVLRRQLSLFGWEPGSRKQVFLAASSTRQVQYDIHLSRVLSNKSHGVYAVLYEKRLVILCNMDILNPESFAETLGHLLKENDYCAAGSTYFTDLGALPTAYAQALLALQNSPRASGALYRCQDMAMRMVARLLAEHGAPQYLHPALPAIRSYDAAHGTDYYRTLFTYLRCESRQGQAAEELFIHRNTLFQRLEKLQELWPLDLTDPEERFYLLFSFYFRQYTE